MSCPGSGVRGVALVAVAAFGLSACGDSRPVGSVGYVKGFGGMVAADEPRAATVARDVLSAGGSAADAAVALYFTMAVTQPSTASLGGGGVCLVHDRDKKTTEALDFIARPGAEAAAAGPRGAVAVPGNVRGFYALHAKYGRFRWESLLGDAERLARLGMPVSRSFAADLVVGGRLLAADPEAARVFFVNGHPAREGETVEQHDLAAVLARIRRAPGDFYVGTMAQSFAEGAHRIGATLTAQDLEAMRPQFVPTLTMPMGDELLHVAPPPAAAGIVAAQLVAALGEQWARAGENRPHLLAEAEARAFAARSGWMNQDGSPRGAVDLLAQAKAIAAGIDAAHHQPVQADKPADSIPAAGFAVMDGDGNAVACTVSAYGLFGIGHMVPGTGVFLAAAPGLNSGAPALGPMMVVNPNVRELRFAGAASGGVTAPTALAEVALAALAPGGSLAQAQAMLRLHHSGNPDVTFVEDGNPDAALLEQRGHHVRAVPLPGRVNALMCGSGRPGFDRCQAETDPRGAGLAVVVGKN